MTSGDDGYYTIKSLHSNKYIGVDINDGKTVKQYTSVTDYAKWAILETSSGNYMLKCKKYEHEDKCLATVTPQQFEGGNLYLMNYSDDNNYWDEWEFNEIEYSFTLHHYYDYGYEERFSDADETASQKIQSYHNAVAERLLQIFGVIVYSECENSPFESRADHCKKLMHGEDDYLDYIWFDEDCAHGSGSEPNIHLTRTAINSEKFPNSNILTPVIWTGYILPTVNHRASVTFNKRSIVMTPYNMTDFDEVTSKYVNESSDNVKKDSIYELLHEVCHTLGTYDHYCYYNYKLYDPSNTPCTNEHCVICVNHIEEKYCIMFANPSEVIDQTADDDLLCQDCIQIIREHLADHHELS